MFRAFIGPVKDSGVRADHLVMETATTEQSRTLSPVRARKSFALKALAVSTLAAFTVFAVLVITADPVVSNLCEDPTSLTMDCQLVDPSLFGAG